MNPNFGLLKKSTMNVQRSGELHADEVLFARAAHRRNFLTSGRPLSSDG